MNTAIGSTKKSLHTEVATHGRDSIVLLLLVAVVTVLALSLWKVHSFPSHPWYRSIPDFAKQLAAIIGAAVTAISLWVKAASITRRILKRKRTKLRFKDVGHLVQAVFERVIKHRRLFGTCIVTLICIGIILSLLLVRIPRSKQIAYLLHPKSADPTRPSGLVVSPDNTEIYVADEEAQQLVIFAASPLEKRHTISLPDKPWQIAVTPDGGEIWITSIVSGVVIVLDHATYKLIARFQTAVKPHWIVITPNGKKAYVGNEGPVPDGNISVIDVLQHRPIRTIVDVNCPEGLDIAKDTKLLYVASQCGWQHDPVFVIDTTTDEVLRDQTIFDMAVGGAVAVTPDGTKVYVARSNFRWPGPFAWWDLSRTDRTPLGVIDVSFVGKPKIKGNVILKTSVSCIAITRDGKYALVGNGNDVTIISTRTDKFVNKVSLPSAANAIAVGVDDWVYVTVPQQGQLFAFSLKGLV
jgi:DNA-binding beta-propeller fold protein YncE